ncbi:MAG: PrsW family glutamic-type intramembrane protease [Oscillospiraceae bacterium]|nr:PrsW family glutamic-type intramembrane protease [Oscillospiraceae bacterium]
MLRSGRAPNSTKYWFCCRSRSQPAAARCTDQSAHSGLPFDLLQLIELFRKICIFECEVRRMNRNYLIALALIPGIFILLRVYMNDRIEREPVRMVLRLVLFGVLSTIPAAVLEQIVDAYLLAPLADYRLFSALSSAFLSAAFVEEGLKLVFLRVSTWNSNEFDYQYDAIVYAVSVSLGFAMLENLLYVLQNGLATAILRAFSSMPLHAFCGVFMGYHYGQAKQAQMDQNASSQRAELWKAFSIPFLIHGAADALLMYNSDGTWILFLVGLIGLYVVAIRKLRFCSEHDVNFVTHAPYPPLETYDADSPAADNRRGRTDAFSVAGFVLGIVSFLTMTVFMLPNILAVIFSAVGLTRGRNGLAVAGLSMGVLSILIGSGIVLFGIL